MLFVTGTGPADAHDIAVGCLAKPYTQKELKLAIETIAAKLEGKKPTRMPKRLTLYG